MPWPTKSKREADIFLMPSRFEPCGLNQMYSLKYGAVPVVRAVGGLDDTVEEWNPTLRTGTGFKFEPYEPQAFLGAIDRALAAFQDKEYKESWTQLMQNGMAQDFSWTSRHASTLPSTKRRHERGAEHSQPGCHSSRVPQLWPFGFFAARSLRRVPRVSILRPGKARSYAIASGFPSPWRRG